MKSKSASKLCEKWGVSVKEFNNMMQQRGLINGERITELGLSKGLVMKSYMGNDYIAYPEDLPELQDLK